jgi:hypothetical protein
MKTIRKAPGFLQVPLLALAALLLFILDGINVNTSSFTSYTPDESK